MSTLKELLDRKAALDREIESTRKEEHANAIEKVKALMQEYGLSISDISVKAPTRQSSASKGGKVAPKYRNNATGETWSGRGLQPKWLRAALSSGHQLSEFVI